MQNLPDKEKAVAVMSEIRKDLEKLYNYYKDEPALAADPPVGRFLQRFTPDVFVENDMQSKDTSYSENKGQRVVVCLRDKTKPPQYPIIEKNTIMFVVLHEMAHLMTETIGHTQEFWTNFKRLLGVTSFSKITLKALGNRFRACWTFFHFQKCKNNISTSIMLE